MKPAASGISLRILLPGGFIFLIIAASVQASDLNGRAVVLDDEDKILSWIDPDPAIAYPAMIDLSVQFLSKDVMRVHGYPLYYCYSVYERKPPHGGRNWYSNPTDVLSGLIHGYAVDYSAYSSHVDLREETVAFARYMIREGSTPANPEWRWPSIPYTQDHGGVLPPRNSDIGGAIAPHLAGKLGRYYIWLYKLTGDPEFLDAARACADALTCNVRTGNQHQSPWPYRVFPDTGAVYQGSEYCADVIDPVALFDALIDLGRDPDGRYQNARNIAWDWLISPRGPMTTHNWSNFFEDIGTDFTNDCQINIGETARYILEHRQRDPDWSIHARTLIHKMETMFGEMHWGARVMNEQKVYMIPMISHTARYASVCALYYEISGEEIYREKAFRAANWSTYGSCPEKDRIFVEIMDSDYGWFSDCHSDYVQHLFSILASVPEWAPPGQDHLLRSSSVVQTIDYSPDCIQYRTFDPNAVEIFRLAEKPVGIVAGTVPLPRRQDLKTPGWTWKNLDPGGICRIRHDRHRDILVSRIPGTAVELQLFMPSHIYRPGDECRLDAEIRNPTTAVLTDFPLVVILDIYGDYWFGPSWSSEFNAYYFSYPPGNTRFTLISDFIWPETSSSSDGLLFRAGLIDPAIFRIIGDTAVWPFGWHSGD